MMDVGCKRLFACDECGIIEELDYRLARAIKYPEYGEFQFDHCGCDKVSDEFFYCGYCEDAWVDKPMRQNFGKRKTGREYRRKMRRQHFKKFRDRKGFSHVFAAPYLNSGRWDNEKCEWIGEDSHICHPQNSKNKGFLKRMSNKKVRKAKLDLPQKGNGHRKVFDYWWTLY